MLCQVEMRRGEYLRSIPRGGTRLQLGADGELRLNSTEAGAKDEVRPSSGGWLAKLWSGRRGEVAKGVLLTEGRVSHVRLSRRCRLAAFTQPHRPGVQLLPSAYRAPASAANTCVLQLHDEGELCAYSLRNLGNENHGSRAKWKPLWCATP